MSDTMMSMTPQMVPADSLEGLSSFLDGLSGQAPQLSLSVLPNIIKDCASVFLDYKKMKINDRQFHERCKFINRKLNLDYENERLGMLLNHKQQMAQTKAYQKTELARTRAQKEAAVMHINAQKTAALAQTNANRDVSLEAIRSQTQVALEQIAHEERREIADRKLHHRQERERQERERHEFDRLLQEEARQFDEKRRMIVADQKVKHKFATELQDTCSLLNKKIVSGKATKLEMEYCMSLTMLQVKAFEESFDVVDSICRVLGGGS